MFADSTADVPAVVRFGALNGQSVLRQPTGWIHADHVCNFYAVPQPWKDKFSTAGDSVLSQRKEVIKRRVNSTFEA